MSYTNCVTIFSNFYNVSFAFVQSKDYYINPCAKAVHRFLGLFALKCALGEKHMNNLKKNRCFDKFVITVVFCAFLNIFFFYFDRYRKINNLERRIIKE